VTGDDRRKPGLPLDGLAHVEIEDMAKASVAELAAQRFVSDDVDSVEVDERRATMRSARDEEPSGSAVGRRTRARSW
jgi:hypothetical protein